MIKHLILVAKGFCMGAADVVPGVSGGTMAFILGIYEQLLAAIRSFDLVWLRHIFSLRWREALTCPHFDFLIPLGIGLVGAVLFFTRVIPLPVLLYTHPEPIYGLFFGLIIGSIVTLLPSTGRLDIAAGLWILLGTIVGWLIVTLVPMDTPDTGWFIFFSGLIAISAMLLPGISGSFILLILNQYDTVLQAISQFTPSVLIPFALGAICGVLLFSRLAGWLLSHYHRPSLLVIIGILTGSLWRIWPFQIRTFVEVGGKQKLIDATPQIPTAFDHTVWLALGMMLLGLVLVLLIHKLAVHHQKT